MNKPIPLCIYCQAAEGTTRDHVPPKGLFAEPRPSNLITVPACDPCNKGFGEDDDYFLNIAMAWTASETKDGAIVAASRVRSMRRREGRRKWKPVLETLTPIEIRSKRGIVVERSFTFRIETARLLGTVNRMIRGLYFHETKTALPIGATVQSVTLHDYTELHGHEPSKMALIECLKAIPSKTIGESTFTYWHFLIDGNSDRSFWCLEFYEQLAFLGATAPQS